MDYTPLAGVDDVRAAIGRDLTSDEEGRCESVLAKASELFRLRAKQQFTPGRSDVRLRVTGGVVYLPERPVTEVHSVKDDDGHAVSYRRRKSMLTMSPRCPDFVIVDYSHGAAEVPELVRRTIAEIAVKVLNVDPRAAAGVVQHSKGALEYTESETYAAWAVGGQTMLAPDDDRIALSFRPARRPGLIVMQP
jgi:hypothetical protein